MNSIRDWAQAYVEGIPRTVTPYTPIDPQDILRYFDGMYPEVLTGCCSTANEEHLVQVAELLHRITVEKIRNLYFEQTGKSHPGLANIRV